jgi:hypothetical protein
VRSDVTHDELWAGVARLIEGVGTLEQLSQQGLAAIRAGAGKSGGEGRPNAGMVAQLLMARRRYEQALAVLADVVGATDDHIVVMKGVEVAQHYPDPIQRPFGDVDVLTARPGALSEALQRIGYREQLDIVPDDHHHLPPLVRPGGEVPIEAHFRPGWLSWMTPPSTEELIERAVPATTPVDGLWTLDPIDHCLFVAVHHWADGPFIRARDLVDIAALRLGLDGEEVERRAEAWGIGRMWSLTGRCADALLLDGPTSLSTRLLTGHISRGRLQGPIAHRAAVYLADFLVTSPRRAAGGVVHKLRRREVVNSVAG